MAKQTSHFGFVKPEINEFYDVNVQNDNWDKIDVLMKEVQTFVGYTDTDKDIYGVEVDFQNNTFTRLAAARGKEPGEDFDSVNAFGGRRRCNVTNDGIVTVYNDDSYYVDTGYTEYSFSSVNTGEMIPTNEPVQSMVEQPKFYYRVVPLLLEEIADGSGFHIRKAAYYVSDTKKPGFKVHPAFVHDGVEKDFIYLAAYEASIVGADLWSIADVLPATGTTGIPNIGTAKTIAGIRGTGWTVANIHSLSVTQLLFLIEYASFHMQEHLSQGIDSTGQLMKTGATKNLYDGNASDYEWHPDDDSTPVPSYRGEENFYGNASCFVDGIQVSHIKDYRIDVSISNVDTKITPECYGFSGYISAFGYSEDFDWAFIPSEFDGTSVLPVGDCCIFPEDTTVVLGLGGYYYDGSYAGAFCWDLRTLDEERLAYTGTRLLYIPQ